MDDPGAAFAAFVLVFLLKLRLVMFFMGWIPALIANVKRRSAGLRGPIDLEVTTPRAIAA